MDADGATAGDDEAEGLRRVGAGMRLVLLGMAATVVAEVGFAVAVGLSVQGGGKDPVATIQSLRRSTLLRMLNADRPAAATALNGLAVLACVLGVAGKFFVARGPVSSGVAGFAVASILADGLGLGLYAAGQVGPAGEASTELGDLAPLLGMLGYFLFLRVLARLAVHLRSPGLALRTRRQQIGSLGLFFGSFLIAALAAPAGAAALILPGLLISLGILTLFVLYARLVRDLRRLSEAAADAAAGAD